MNVSLKKWDISDAKDLAEVLSNKKIHDNLRDGLPYPYTEHDGREFITSVLASDENEMFSPTIQRTPVFFLLPQERLSRKGQSF